MIIGNHQAGLTSEILCMYKFWWKFDVWDLPISLDSRLRPTLLFAYLMCDRKHTISTLSVLSHLNMNKMRSQVINETTTTTISFFSQFMIHFSLFFSDGNINFLKCNTLSSTSGISDRLKSIHSTTSFTLNITIKKRKK